MKFFWLVVALLGVYFLLTGEEVLGGALSLLGIIFGGGGVLAIVIAVVALIIRAVFKNDEW